MSPTSGSSQFQFDKQRVEARITASSGQTTRGFFFTAGTGRLGAAERERVGELLNGATGFFPFEIQGSEGARTVLYNRERVILVGLHENEEERVPGYSVATRRFVSIFLSNGQRVVGHVRVYQPQGRDRLSDWTRQSDVFRYLETGGGIILVNAAHIVDVSEVPEP
jgi:hypothetical protein